MSKAEREKWALDVLMSRRSCRKFTQQPVGRDELATLVDAARLAPTARNVQPWEFVVVTDPGTRQRLADISEHGKFMAESPAVIVVLCKDTKYYVEDGAAAVQNILLAAEAIGLATCWIAGDKKTYAPTVVKLLGAPAEYKLVAFVAIGHRAMETARADKRDLDNVIHWEQF